MIGKTDRHEQWRSAMKKDNDKRLLTAADLRCHAEKRLRAKTTDMHSSRSEVETQKLVHELEVHQIELEMQNEELRRAQAELEASRNRYADLYDFAPVGYFTFDDNGRIVEVNLAGAGLLGVDRQLLINKPFSAFVIKDDQDIFRAHVKETLKRETRQISEIRLGRKDGSSLLVQLQSVAAGDSAGSCTLCRTATIDITEHKLLEVELRHQAYHDTLTNLPNRRLLMEILAIELAKARRGQERLAVLFLDLDHFKYINDSLGHEAGDKLLKEVGIRLQQSVRASDTISRTGGDEFNILLTDIPRVDDIFTIAQKVVCSFNKPFVINGHELGITTSIGISIYPEDGGSIEKLFKNADIAMYHTKDNGGNSYQFYNPSMNIRSTERLGLGSQLSQALEHRQLVIHYQPQLTIGTQQVLCAEALVRWRHPERGLLAPVHFIPLAEEMGYLAAIDEWVLRTACAQVREWHNAGLMRVCVAVNLSAKEFQKSDLIERITGILRETGLDPGQLAVEITESVAMRNLEQTLPKMIKLAEMGVGISIDDFGTGYSSLNYLKKLPIQKLKIDKSFIRDLASDSDDGAIVGAVIVMARKLNMKVIAEGVETEEQLEHLKSLGCDEMQGYLFSKPLPANEFKEFMAVSK
jgi:diguanylate cyclase (GGDEF)-like protein/PAS domain S-box-containing protein